MKLDEKVSIVIKQVYDDAKDDSREEDLASDHVEMVE